jgi:predicted RNA-binding protein with PIN domain
MSSRKLKETTPGREGVPLYIVDGYNVIFSGRSLESSRGIEDSRIRFLTLLGNYGRRKKVEILVVWDGKGGPPGPGRGRRGSAETSPLPVKSLQSGEGQSADEKIVRLVERNRKRKRITVVSNDRRHIVGVVKNLGAKTMSVQEFLTLVGLPTGSAKEGPPRARGSSGSKPEDAGREKRAAADLSVDDWLTLFESKEE